MTAGSPHPICTHHGPVTLRYKAFDLERYSEESRMLCKLHYAQTAQDALMNLLTHMQILVPVQQAAKGSLAWHTSELLNSYYRLAATVQRDNGNFEAAYFATRTIVSYASTGRMCFLFHFWGS